MWVLAAVSIAILAFAGLRSLLEIRSSIMIARVLQTRLVVDLRSEVYRKLQKLSFRFFDANASGNIITRLVSDIQGVRMFVDGVVVQSIVLVTSTAIYLVYMLSMHRTLTAACLLTTPLIWLASQRFSQRVNPAYAESRDLLDRQTGTLSESIRGVHVVKGFAREREELEKFNRAADSLRDKRKWIFDQVSCFNPFVQLLTQCNIMVLLAFGGYLVVMQETTPGYTGISVGQLLVFAGLLQQFSGQVSNIATIADTIQQSLSSARRVFEVLDTRAEITSPPDAVRLLTKPAGSVKFENVSFSYRTGSPVLHNLSFEARPGECIAILGATGSGKSTVLSLIPRFYDPTAGRIAIDGLDLRTVAVDDLRRNIGIVFQESFLFSNTIHFNIAFGAPDAGRATVERAARIAAAHDFIAALPKGYDTVLREGGANLSGGQRQRIAIARAVLLDPSILLLDDPTAAIDSETEEEIMTAINGAMAGRTTFIVAHRLSTLRRADRVIVLDRGRLVQSGTHNTLMNERGHYRSVAHAQIPDEESLRILTGDDL
jgi:ATP-binding cassette subfamily B protein